MLDYVIVFALGFLIAGLVGFAMLPVVWARALRLTRRHLEIGIPISMSEVRAGQDHIRAEAALAVRRIEAKYESERDRRVAAMAEAGRLTETVRRLTADNEARLGRIRLLEQDGVGASVRLLDLEQEQSSHKAELAASKVTMALREDDIADLKRQIDAARMEIDGQRVEIVALKTKLGNAEDESTRRQRQLTEVTASAVDRDGRIERQGVDLSRRDALLTEAQARLAEAQAGLGAAEISLAARTADVRALEIAQKELETRLASMAADLRKRDAAIADREGRLAFAAGREAELTNELTRLKSGAQRAVGDGPAAAAGPKLDRLSAEAQLEVVRAERARLQAEVASLKRSAREGWSTIEADNRALRSEMARIAALIAREAAARKGSPMAKVAELVAANDEPGRDDRSASKSGSEADKWIEAPPV